MSTPELFWIITKDRHRHCHGICGLRAILPILLGTSFIVMLPGADEETIFKGAHGLYSVRYPSSWYLLGEPSGEVLDVVNFPPSLRVRGVILTEQGARITVLKKPDDISTLEKWIQQDVLNSEIESRREVPASTASNGCKKLIEVKWKWDDGGGPNFSVQETAYYCVAKTGIYNIQLSYMSNNLEGPKLSGVALRVAHSLRTGQ